MTGAVGETDWPLAGWPTLQSEALEVRGTLWLMGELLESGVIDVDRAVLADDAICADGSRLPWKDVDAQIKKFRNR